MQGAAAAGWSPGQSPPLRGVAAPRGLRCQVETGDQKNGSEAAQKPGA